MQSSHHGDEPSCPVLQLQTDVADSWCCAADGSDKGLVGLILRHVIGNMRPRMGDSERRTLKPK
jgi:hypothetical protein